MGSGVPTIWEDIRSLVSTLAVDIFFQWCTKCSAMNRHYVRLCNWWRGSADSKLLFKLCRTLPPAMGALYTVFWQAGHVDSWRCSSNSNKRVCICDICYKQKHVRKQISIMCNRIEHLRSSGNPQAQYTDTRTCHLHRECRLTTHTDITPPHPSRPWSKQWVDNNNNKRFSSYEKSLPLPRRLLLRRGWWSLLKMSLLDLTVESGIPVDVMRHL